MDAPQLIERLRALIADPFVGPLRMEGVEEPKIALTCDELELLLSRWRS